MPGAGFREPFGGGLRTMKYRRNLKGREKGRLNRLLPRLPSFLFIPSGMGVLPVKKAKCCLCCVNWRNVIIYLLLTILMVILLCLLPRWILCFLVAALALGCAALLMMRR